MAQAPHDAPDAQETISTVDARAGRTGNKVRYVLIVGVILAVVFMIGAFFESPDAPADRPNSGEEPPLRD